jgi:membrane-associated phospholipid phosphatase
MDIDYLLLLQRFRESINDALTPFMEAVSLFAVTFLIVIPVFVYWVVDKKKGLYTLVSYYVCCGINAIVKLTACIYRPWIRDARVKPAGDAITTATGYSFPSGHTVSAGPIYGGLAVSAWSWKKWVSVILIFLAVLTGFSRNYLGVHTPQDVAVGCLESALWLFVIAKIFKYVEAHPEKENLLLLLSAVIGCLGIVYITFKSYPMDYVDGKLLVDPQKMMNDGYGDICLLIAFPAARFVEKTWIKFKPTGLKGLGWLTGLVGLIPLILMIQFLKAPLDGLLGSHWGHFAYSFIVVFYCIALWPLVIKLVTGREKAE